MVTKYEKYKDSGVEWVGYIPEHWHVRKIKYLFGIGRGRVISQQELKDDGIYPVYSSQTLDDGCLGYINTFDFEGKYLTWTTDGANAGTVFLRGGKFNCTNVCGTLKSKTKDDIRFMKYVLQFSALNNKRPDTNGAKIMNNEMAVLDVTLPFVDEQEKIADYLDKKSEAIDKFIKNKEDLINLLEEEKKAIITKALTKGLDKNVSLKDSGEDWLGEIPQHWKTYRTKFLFSLIAKPSGRKHDHELLSIYTDIGVKPRQELAEKGNKASSTDGYWLVKKGDFIVNKLLAWMGAIGLSEYDGVTSPAYDILRKNRSLDEYYYNYLFRCGVLFEEIKKYSKGIMEMRLRLYFTEFSKIFLPYPPLEEQKAIVAHLDNECKKIDDLKAKYRQEIDLIKEYKERLIYDVVTGKMSVLEH